MDSSATVICWFRRDLRLHDHAALYHALASGASVQPVFIFDTDIIGKLENKADARVAFIHQQVSQLHIRLREICRSGVAVYIGSPAEAWTQILMDFNPVAVYYNHDYEPKAVERDHRIGSWLAKRRVAAHAFKDQVIFEKNDVVKEDGTPYLIYTPYRKRWMSTLNEQALKSYRCEEFYVNFRPFQGNVPPL